jgi:hypothetical protein
VYRRRVQAIRDRTTASSRTPQHAGRPTCAPTEEPPPPVRFTVVHHLLAAPHDPYNIPESPVFLHRPGVRWSRGRRGRAPYAPPAGRLPAPLRLSAATNQLRVSPSTFSTPPPDDSPTGMALGTTLRLFHLVQGVFREPGTFSR